MEAYIYQLFGIDKITPKIRNQLVDYLDNYHYTYGGIYDALRYFYEVKGGDKEKAYEGIGIVPYMYAEAKKYYSKLRMAQGKNENKRFEDYKPGFDKTIRIAPPRREPIRRKQFSFLEEDLPAE